MLFIFFTLVSHALALIFLALAASHALAATHAPATSRALALIFFALAASLAPASTRLSPWYLI